MKLSFTLKEQFLFDSVKYLLKKQGVIIKTKIISLLILIIAFGSYSTYFYFHKKNIYLTIAIVAFFLVFTFLYLKFLDYTFEKKVRKYIEVNNSEDIGKDFFIQTEGDYLIFGRFDGKNEMKFRKSSILEETDVKKYLFFLVKKDMVIFLPKEEFSDEEVRNFQKSLELPKDEERFRKKTSI